jgi:hemerythrin-like domain-containing protein
MSELVGGVEVPPKANTPACDNLRDDHRKIEIYLDRLLAVLQAPRAEEVPEVRAIVEEIQRLRAIHFEKEENLFYPKLRTALPELLGEMDGQHDVIREVGTHVTQMLADPPQPPDARWLHELHLFGIEFHDHIQHHIVDEEDHLFRLADEELSAAEQADLEHAMVAIEKRMTSS